MPRLFLIGRPDASLAGSIVVNVTSPAADGSVTPVSLQLPVGSALPLTVPAEAVIPASNLAPLVGGAAGDLRLQNGPALDLILPFDLPVGTQWFNLQFAAAVTGELALSIPGSASKPFAAVRACGAFAFAGVPATFTSRPFCFEVSIPDLPMNPLGASAPLLGIRPPHLGIDFPKLTLPWTFPDLPTLPWVLAGFSGAAGSLPLKVSYDSVSIDAGFAGAKVTVDLKHLQIASSFGSLDGDLHLVLTATGIDFTSSTFQIYQPDIAHAVTIPFSSATLNPECLVLGWTEHKLHELLALLAPDLGKNAIPVEGVTFRLLSSNGAVTELRMDWTMSGQDIAFPGFDLTVPDATYSVIASTGASPRLAMVAGIANGKSISANTDFTWVRPDAASSDDGSRETHGHEAAQSGDKPFLSLTATAKQDAGVLLMNLPLDGSSKLPKFFQQLSTPLPALAGNCSGSDLTSVSLKDATWGKIQVDFNPDALTLPFLHAVENTVEQFLTVQAPATLTIDLTAGIVLDVPLDITAKLGSIALETDVDVQFNLETFGFTIHDSDGLALNLKNPVSGDLFGLQWDIHSKRGETQGFEVLRLVTKDSNFQLKQGADAVFQLEFAKATAQGSPIIFGVTNLVIGAKGVDLDADVQAKPAKLQGIDTEFVFVHGTFQIRQNRLVDFTIAGSGPLPPALVGSATASIALQFHQNDSKAIELVSAAAKLEGKNLLQCQGTRFKFSVEALGLKYVQDGGTYHLYFTITGSAKYSPLDSDDSGGPLAWLPQIELRLMECPLTGDARVISKHVQFLIEMPRKLTFSILGCFEMEVRAIGFVPQADMFDAYASAMRLSGQIKFAESGGDAIDARIDFHDLYIGLPQAGSIVPRIYCKELGVKLKVASAFELNGIVDFLDNEEIQPGIIASGFRGQGTIAIQGLPTLSGSFAFLRVRDINGTDWKRAWFLYLEVDKISFEIPVVELFIREVGLGFGYRYTLAMIQESDNIQDPKQLLKTLKDLSVSQGDLSSFNQWRVDVGSSGDPRWTVVLRALISETSATQVPTEWLEEAEKILSCLFIFDAVIALRSDLTFLMNVRGWLNTNYWDYVNNTNGVRTAPLVSGFVLLSPRQKRFLAHVGSNPGARFGDHPPIPDFLKAAIRGSYFTATLLVEPGLIHYELGWPNMLGWTAQIGPLTGEFRGGSIFRVSTTEIVVGVSYQARAALDINSGVDFGFLGASLTAHASVAYGTRYIGVLALKDTSSKSAFYAVEGIDIQVAVAIKFWLKINVFLGTIELDFNFSFAVAFSASVQVGLLLQSPYAGIRGTATVGINIMGHGLNFGITIAAFPDAVGTARGITDKFLSIGLEATDVQPIPGEPPSLGDSPSGAAPQVEAMPAAHALAAAAPVAPQVAKFITPDYTVFAIPPKQRGGLFYFLLFPSANRHDASGRLGFLPTPPDDAAAVTADFEWTLPAAIAGLEQWIPNSTAADGKKGQFEAVAGATIEWSADWGPIPDSNTKGGGTQSMTLGFLLRYAYTLRNSAPTEKQDTTPINDPIWPKHDTPLGDDRVQNPADSNYEAAVRGARDQVLSPRFKTDPYSTFDSEMSQAYSFRTTVYKPDPVADGGAENSIPQAVHLRSSIIQQMVRDAGSFAATQSRPDPASIAFRMGLVFRAPEANVPEWLLLGDTSGAGGSGGTISQRNTTAVTTPDTTVSGNVDVFNRQVDRFDQHPPRFDNVRQFADDNTIAIAWDLSWENQPGSLAQEDPEHHLGYYIVRRRPLDGLDRGLEYKVRPADILHRANRTDSTTGATTEIPIRLRTRFQVLDHFNYETQAEQAALPPDGKTYLYSITPVDVAGHASPRPLTISVTRLPHQPPLVPSDAEVTVDYATAAPLPQADHPVMNPVKRVTVAWTPVSTPPGTPRVPASRYRLLFRREQTLPIGSYGLDSSAQGSQSRGLPVSNARPLRTDIAVGLTRITPPLANDGREYYEAKFTDPVSGDGLTDMGVYPGPGANWRPDSWRLFVQAESQTRVWSAMAPAQVRLAFNNGVSSYVTRPASIEWIAQPIPFSPLPPVDEQASVGYAEVPMPVNASLAAGVVEYAVHPDKPRGVSFRWNQGVSGSTVPPDLQAGYRVYEFDVDAHLPQDLNTNLNAGNLRLIQEIELLPEADVAVTPADTMHTERWEAWYAATFQRIEISRTKGLKTPLSGWYSFRDSKVVWPPVSGMYAPGPNPPATLPRMHPYLQAVLDELRSNAAGNVVDLAPIRPTQPNPALDQFLQETALSADPYGWRILQRMGLAICFTLRDPKTGDAIAGADALPSVQNAVMNQLAKLVDPTKPDFSGCANFVHVEQLYQPGMSVQIAAGANPQPGDVGAAVPEDALLSAVQISLRPIAEQVYQYFSVELTVPQPVGADTTATLTFTLQNQKPITVIELTALPSSASSSDETGQFVIDQSSLTRPLAIPRSGQVTLLLRAEEFAAGPVASDMGTIQGSSFDFTDNLATYFTADEDRWKIDGDIWGPLETYLTLPGISLPAFSTDNPDLLPELLSWLSRFLDLSPKTTDRGPYIATGYPRLVSPLPVAPGPDGRISYIQLITDPYAHAYRYYVWPYGRYDALWQAVAQSNIFATPPDVALVGELDPTQGGLDVVLDRVREVAPPLVLSSRRVDAPATPAVPAAPGAIWEVIVAKHPEQTLSERNWTVARQLSFRQVAFTMLRTYGFQGAKAALSSALLSAPTNYAFTIQNVENLPSRNLLPGPYPATETERLDPANAADLLAIDLPLRLSPFSQGAQVLQWRALPYYYKYSLVLAAQAARIASTSVSVVQSSFEYLAPTPVVQADAKREAEFGEHLVFRVRLFRIQLANHFECLPPSAQAEWIIENPCEHDAPAAGGTPLRKYSSLPDTGVIYQLVLVKQPLLTEALVEYYFDQTAMKYSLRQFSKDFIGLDFNLDVPDALTDRQARIFLEASLFDQEYTQAQHDADVGRAVPDLAAVNDAIAETVHRWFPARGVSHTVVLTGALADAVEFRACDNIVLAWDGQFPGALEAWAVSVDPVLASSIRLLNMEPITTIPRLLDPAVVAVPRSSLLVEADHVVWNGGTTPGLLAALDAANAALPMNSPGRTALQNLRNELNATTSNPSLPAVFAGPAPTPAGLVALLGLDPAGPLSQALKVQAAADGSWSLTILGLDLDQPVPAMLALVDEKIPRPDDPRNQALHAALEGIAGMKFTEAIPGVPAELASHVLFAPFLLHLRGAADLTSLIAMYAGRQPDLDSLNRLLADPQTVAPFDAKLAQWSTRRAISSRAVFATLAAALAEPNRVDFPAPDACLLEVFEDLTPSEITELNAAADVAQAAGDPGFASALRRVAAGEKAVRAPIGIDQIAEISSTAVLNPEPGGTLVWNGPVSQDQRLAIQAWAAIPQVGPVFRSLLDQFDTFEHSESFSASTPPDDNSLSRPLVGRLVVTSGTAVWVEQDLDGDQLSALQILAGDITIDASFRAAVQAIITALLGAQNGPIGLPAGWKARPKTGDLLPGKLLIGKAVIQFHGVMSRAEADALIAGVSVPDQAAIGELFGDSQSAGLNGASIQVRTRLGTASASALTALDTTLA